MSIFVKNTQTCWLTVLIVSFGVLISHTKFQHDSSYNRKQAQKQKILEKTISDGPSANLRQLFNSNVTNVSVISGLRIELGPSEVVFFPYQS